MTLRVAIAAAVAVAALPAAQAAGAQSGTLTPSGKARFPERSLVLTLPRGIAPSPAAIGVREDGQPVDGLRVLPLGRRFAVLLLIDASASMRGRPLSGALRAARAFAAQRPPYQPLGVLTFNDRTRTVLPPITDPARIRRALAARPPLRPYTRMYDAVAAALALFRRGDYESGAIVVLSDGNDYGSAASAAQVGALARRLGAHLYTVGLRSKDFDSAALTGLAAAGGGTYLGAASAARLAGVYRRLGARLANAYLLRYRSLAPAGRRVVVTAGVGAVYGRASYTAPRLRVDGAVPPPVSAPPGDRSLLRSAGGQLLVALLAAGAVLGGVLLSLGGRRRRARLRERIGDYGSPVAPPPDASGAVPGASARSREPRGRRRVALERALDLAQIDMPAGRFVLAVAAADLVLAALVEMLLGGVFGVLVALVGPFAARSLVRRRIRRRRRAFADQLADTINAVASAMRTGNSFAGALSRAVESAPEPAASELRRVVADERLGVPLEQAIDGVAERMASRDLQQVGLVSVLQRETGGNGAEALGRVVENLRARDDVRRLVRTLTAQGRLAQRVLTALPVGVVAFSTAANPEAMRPLYETVVGKLVLVVAVLLEIAGVVWIRKIVNIEE